MRDILALEENAARRRILEYNEDDVRATLALRKWLDGPARSIPSVADWPLACSSTWLGGSSRGVFGARVSMTSARLARS